MISSKSFRSNPKGEIELIFSKLCNYINRLLRRRLLAMTAPDYFQLKKYLVQINDLYINRNSYQK